jgi:hypothetical protein
VSRKQKESHGTMDTIPLPTAGKIFANGKAIEPLRDIVNPERLRLLWWDGAKATIGSQVECDGQKYAPAPIDPTILQALTLPTGIAACGSPGHLLTDIAKLATDFTSFPENSVAAASRWVLSSWFPEKQPAPGLSLIGPDTTAGTQLFQLLSCLCRHPLLLTEVSTAGLLALPTEWDLTLLIHQPQLTVEVERVLSIARKRSGLIPRGGRLFDLHFGVATYTELGSTYRPGVIPRIEISAVPAREGLPVLDKPMRQKIANDFQPKLLSYRLANYAKVLNSAFDAPGFTPQMRDLAQNLSACTPDNPDLQAQILELLRTQDKEIRSAAWLDLNIVIVETILAFVHGAKEDCVYVAEIAEAAEAILQGRDEPRKLPPRAVGERLGPLGLITEPRNSKGIRLLLTKEVSRCVHELAYRFSVPSIQDGAKRCPHCKEMERHCPERRDQAK